MIVAGSNTKCCATCSYWDGERKPNYNFVYYELKQGKCYKVNVFTGFPMMPNYYCGKWEKWPSLR